MSQNAASSHTPPYDVFLSHAGEDKDTIARPLWKRLRELKLSVFLDDESFVLGEHCPDVMKHAMETASVGVFVMSPEFVAKEWTMRELLAFVRRYERAIDAKETPPMLISIFYRLQTKECRNPAIFDTYSDLFHRHGLFQRAIEGTVSLREVWHALDMAATLWSIRNDVGATNDNHPHMVSTRASFIRIIQDSILECLRKERPRLVEKCNPVVTNEVAQQDVYTPFNMVPPNPPRLTLNYGSPTTCEGKLKTAVLAKSGKRIVAVVATGKGGVGKTCALRGLAEDIEIQRVFCGGMLYIELGNDATLSNLVQGVAKTVECTGGSDLANLIRTVKSVKEASRKASKWFAERSCLFLVDDIWDVNGINSSILTTLGQMVNSSSRMVYTTRDRHFLDEAEETIEFKENEPLGVLSQQMLLTHAGFKRNTELDHKNKEAFEYFLTLCDGLPLGFGIVGSSIRRYSRDCLRAQDAWSEFYTDVLSKEENLMETAAGTYGKLPKIVDLSLQVLEKRSGHEKFWYWFRALSVLRKQQSVPDQMLRKLWDLGTLKDTRNVVESLADVSVVQMTRSAGSVSVKLHDLVLDIATRKATQRGEIEPFFQKLVHNYIRSERRNKRDDALISAKLDTSAGKRLLVQGTKELDQTNAVKRIKIGESTCAQDGLLVERKHTGVQRDSTEEHVAHISQFSHAWWNTEDDGYIFNNLCRILQRAGYVNELLYLLSQPQWIVKRMVKSGILSVEQDLDHGITVCNDIGSQYTKHKDHLQMIAQAARLSASFINKNPCVQEAWFQLHGRLLWHAMQNELTSDFVQRMEKCAPKPWLKAGPGFLQQAGVGALQVLTAAGEVLCMREEPDTTWIMSGSEADRMYVGRYDRSNEYYEEKSLEAPEEMMMDFCTHASFLHDQQSLVTVHDDERIWVWNRQSGECEESVPHDCPTHSEFVNFVAEGSLLACQRNDYSIRLWDTLNGEPVAQPLRGHTAAVKCVAMSADRTRIVSGSEDYTVRVWDAQTGNAVGQPFRGHTQEVRCLTMSADGNRIVSGSRDKTVRVWNAQSGNPVGQPLQGHKGSVVCVAMSNDGSRIVSGSSDETVRVWDAQSGNVVGQPLEGHTNPVVCVLVSTDGKRVVSGSWDKTVRVWNVQVGNAVRQQLQGHKVRVTCTAMSGDSSYIVTWSTDKKMRVWDAQTGDAVGQPLQGPTDYVYCVQISSESNRIVSGSNDNTVYVWDWDRERRTAVGKPLQGHTDSVQGVAVSADGTRVVSGSKDKTVRFWDAQTGNALIQPLRGHTGDVNCVALSTDGTRIASGSADGTVRVWNAQTGNAVAQPLKGHTEPVRGITFSADGTRIASHSDDNTLRVWNVQTGNAVGQPLQPEHSWTSFAVSADGTHIVAKEWDILKLWVFNAGGGKYVLDITSRDAMWQRTIDQLELSWSQPYLWSRKRYVLGSAEDGSEIVLGSCELDVGNINEGDVYFSYFHTSCRIVR